ncbi:MAG: pentapeptide repeat-containing protein, partial [Moorea sp. SIO4A3]|nr:pentapeptide repeat-containing protein [Moorena sp. SIO4A3]
ANLKNANLAGANLAGADLAGADLKNAIYSNEIRSKSCKFEDIYYHCRTIFPEGFDPKSAGMKLIKEVKDIPKR